jgi:hypothetical protein
MAAEEGVRVVERGKVMVEYELFGGERMEKGGRDGGRMDE